MAAALCGVASLGKDDAGMNQDDCCAERFGDGQDRRALAVADGLGSHLHSELASRAAIDGVILGLRGHQGGEVDIVELVREAQRRVVFEAQNFYEGEGREVPAEDEFSTTLILAVEGEHEMAFAWIGNGAILHIHGSALLLESAAKVPWQSANLMLPHIVANEQGKGALTKFISGCSAAEIFDPSTLRISLDQEGYGDVFVICTDGILTAEDRKIGRLKDGSYWQRVSDTEVELYDLLADIVDQPRDLTDDDITGQIQAYLQAVHDAGRQGDDSTLGIIFSRQFMVARKKIFGTSGGALAPGSTWSDLCQD